MTVEIEQANTIAIERLMSARPILKGIATAREVIPGMKDNLFLHAGPPIEWARMSGPLRGAVIGAMLFEGIAKSEAEATSMVERGEVEFDSCHHHGAVGPMAGVTSASMKVYVVEMPSMATSRFPISMRVMEKSCVTVRTAKKC
ncbi:MAG: DUF1116 domain-containing protein [Anaerolineales bacterium]|nr:DUF1116 domain-containing protein [Anaerolineales bacterium]